ncbi:ATP synthase subunit e, mitochondrial [Sceloporus undulatus]|uniref:ATP synthase subunit e, mitochondrial n=1 Tax=Sceloporus undulatus TaxID=8520 RepID=UPI001C4BE347|nr:ATP synthase subunit e, mitochondrial [Sceloporus undulatus]
MRRSGQHHRCGVRHFRSVCEPRDKMVPPVQVSPLIKFTRYSALLLGMIYGKKRYDYLKPIAEEERRIEAEEKKKREEMERIAKALAEANEDTILK